jgi:hypothetical protein
MQLVAVSMTNISVMLRRWSALFSVCSPGRLCGARLVVVCFIFYIVFFIVISMVE